LAQTPYTAPGGQTALPTEQAPNDITRVESSPAMFGGLVAQSVSEVGKGAEAAANFYNQVSADQVQNDAAEQYLKLMHGDPGKTNPDGSPDTGFFGNRGQAAMDAYPSTMARFDQITKQAKGNLHTVESQLQFDEWSRRMRDNYMSQISSFYDTQSHAWGEETAKNQTKGALNGITSNPTDETDFKHNLADAIGGQIKAGQMNGTIPLGKINDDNTVGPNHIPLKPDAILARKNAIVAGTAMAWNARIEGLAARGQVKEAYKMAQDNVGRLGTDGERIVAGMRAKAEAQTGQQAAAGTANLWPSGQGAAGININEPGWYDAYNGRTEQIENPAHDPNARSPAGAGGFKQWTPSTAARYGVTIGDRASEEQGMRALTRDNFNALQNGLGRAPTPAELYLAHQQGAQGALRLMADPSRRAADIVGMKAITGNGGTADMSAGQFVAMWQAKFNRTPVGAAIASAAPPRAQWATLAGGGGPLPIEQTAFEPSGTAQTPQTTPAGMPLDEGQRLGQAPVGEEQPPIDWEAVRQFRYNQLPANLNQSERGYAERAIDHKITEQAIAEGQTKKDEEERRKKALDTISAFEMKGDYLGAFRAVQNDPYFIAHPTEALKVSDTIEARSGMKKIADLAPNYKDYMSIHDDILNHRIRNPIDLMVLENQGKLYPAGTKQLTEMLNQIDKIQEFGLQDKIQGVLKDASQHLVHDLDVGNFHQVDANGARAMKNFMNEWFRDLDAWREAKGTTEGFPGWEDKNLDERYERIRPKRQMQQDMIQQGIELQGAQEQQQEQQFIPPPPAGVRPAAWDLAIGSRPVRPDTGKQWTPAVWGKYLDFLRGAGEPQIKEFEDKYPSVDIRGILRELDRK
jgi:hypothetical protein